VHQKASRYCRDSESQAPSGRLLQPPLFGIPSFWKAGEILPLCYQQAWPASENYLAAQQSYCALIFFIVDFGVANAMEYRNARAKREGEAVFFGTP
jgi:hypothetical protein